MAALLALCLYLQAVVGQPSGSSAGATVTASVGRVVSVLQVKRMAEFAVSLRGMTPIWTASPSPRFFLLACHSATGAAEACSSLGDARVLLGVRMPLTAVGTLGISGGHVLAAQDVYARRDELKVTWPNAKWDPAKVVQLKAIWDGPSILLPCPSVRLNQSTMALQGEGSIIPAIPGRSPSSPKPARSKAAGMAWGRSILVDLFPEAQGFRSIPHRRIIQGKV